MREMRRKRQQITEQECIAVMKKGTNGIMAVHGEEGYPYAVPLSYVYEDGHIYFHTALEGHKVDAIRANSKVSFCVVDQDMVVPAEVTTYFRSVICFGKARFLEDPAEKMHALRALAEKYSMDYPERTEDEIDHKFDKLHMVSIDVEHMTGKEAIELVKARNEP